MGTYEPDINCPDIEKNHHYKPVPIPPDIENKTIITNIIHRIKYLFDISYTAPIRVFYYIVPGI